MHICVMAPSLLERRSEVAIVSTFILCSPQHAFLGMIGLFACGLFTAEAMDMSARGAESLAATHEARPEPWRLAGRAVAPRSYR